MIGSQIRERGKHDEELSFLRLQQPPLLSSFEILRRVPFTPFFSLLVPYFGIFSHLGLSYPLYPRLFTAHHVVGS